MNNDEITNLNKSGLFNPAALLVIFPFSRHLKLLETWKISVRAFRSTFHVPLAVTDKVLFFGLYFLKYYIVL